MESKYEKILSAEESFAREVALGVHITKSLTVWHYMIPGMFIIDFLRRGSEIKRYSYHFMFPRKLALDAAQAMTQGEEKSQRLLQAEQEVKTWLNSLNLYSEGLHRSQMAAVNLLVDHYTKLLKAESESYYGLIENAYTTRENYEAFLSSLALAEEDLDRNIIETLGKTEKLRDRLIAEKVQVEKQRKKHTDKIFSWIRQIDHEKESEAGPEGGFQGSKRRGAPWENRSELGLWQGIFQTFKEALFSPNALFRTLVFKGGLREPLAFGVLVGSLGTMSGFFWVFLMMSGGLLFFSESIFGQFAAGLIFLMVMIAIPIFWTLWIFFSSGITHLLLLIVRAGGNQYEATFRVVSYSQAAQIWGLIPFIGGSIGWIWQLVVQIIGLREMHETSYSRVIIAFLIPVVFIFFLAVIGVLVFLYGQGKI